MAEIDLAALEAATEGATPGPWIATEEFGTFMYPVAVVTTEDGPEWWVCVNTARRGPAKSDARHIAAFSPDVTEALIAVVRADLAYDAASHDAENAALPDDEADAVRRIHEASEARTAALARFDLTGTTDKGDPS